MRDFQKEKTYLLDFPFSKVKMNSGTYKYNIILIHVKTKYSPQPFQNKCLILAGRQIISSDSSKSMAVFPHCSCPRQPYPLSIVPPYFKLVVKSWINPQGLYQKMVLFQIANWTKWWIPSWYLEYVEEYLSSGLERYIVEVIILGLNQ